MEKRQVVAGAGGVLAAVVASSCCWLPLALLAVGAGATAVGAVTSMIEKFRPLFAVAAIGFLGAAWYFTYFRRPRAAAGKGAEDCCAVTPKEELKSSAGDACCSVAPEGGAKEALCSCCGQKGKRVSSITVAALVLGPLKSEVREGDYILCLNPGCAQVYTGSDGARSFVKSDLAVRVGYKEQDGPHLVCYCFDHSVEEVEAELRASGRTTIPERIKAEVKAGRCACDVKNPQGTCCLGNVNRAMKEAQDRIAGRETAPVGAPAVQCAPPPAAEENHEDCCSLPRRPGARASAVGRLKQVNKVLLPVVSAVILGMVFFPHQIFAFLAKSDSPSSSSAVIDSNLKTVVLRVPGMS